ncbi:hypothetical protein CDL15_Pgr003888 [Punica granatum]|uniref:Disease resistance protein At4g27190-like leucine-rich repeats domain-containing protein n=1 Tax=Punica granatum TaxID=22663 RepID=A0A218XV18_PUNGR|nr:hypothetical protein CDL15_Pgr003888 [Punica granatum]
MDSLSTIWHSQVAADSLSELVEIKVEGCDKLVTLFPPGTVRSFQNLEVLTITSCGALEVVYDTEENAGSDLPSPVEVSKLRELSLDDLANLQHIWRADPREILSFLNLRSVSVMRCRNLGYLFHVSVAKALEQLVELVVAESSLEVIVAKDESVQVAGTLEFVFPRAAKLVLSDLPQLKSFYPGKFISRRPLLEDLMISNSNMVAFDSKKSKAGTFPKVETLHMQHNDNMKQIWSGRRHPKLTSLSSGVHFTNITTLRVENCRSLKNILTPNMVAELPGLATLEIRDCEILEAVIAEEEKARNPITIRLLRDITLDSLPMLVSFCSQNCFTEYPSLMNVTIKNCPEMRAFTSPHLKEKAADTMGENSEEACTNSGDIDIPFFSEMVLFPSLEILVLSDLDSLSVIWHDLLAEKSFDKLRDVKIYHCGKLKRIFSPKTTLERFRNMKKLSIDHCGSLEVLFDIREHRHDPVIKMLLRELSLFSLPELMSVWNADIDGTISFEDLKEVRVTGCPKLKIPTGLPLVRTE